MKKENTGFFAAVYEVVKNIPKGKVMSYGQVAQFLGNGKMSRRVGQALHVNPDPERIPCHRVVFRDGSLTDGFAFGGAGVQRERLEKEGVEFTEDGRVKYEFFEFGVPYKTRF